MNIIPRYHSNKREAIKEGKTISLELEFNIPHKYEFSFYILSRINLKKILLERDGSLDPNEGVEVIFENKNYEELKKDIRIFSEISKTYNCTTEKEKINYGIHISISRKGWNLKDNHCMKVVMFVDNNHDFFQLIGEREPNRYFSFGKTTNSISENLEKIRSNRKYQAVAFRDEDRIEFRLFKSDIQEEKIFKCIETVISIVEYILSIEEEKLPNLEEYLNFIFNDEKNYKNLKRFILGKEEIKNFLLQKEEIKNMIEEKINIKLIEKNIHI